MARRFSVAASARRLTSLPVSIRIPERVERTRLDPDACCCPTNSVDSLESDPTKLVRFRLPRRNRSFPRIVPTSAWFPVPPRRRREDPSWRAPPKSCADVVSSETAMKVIAVRRRTNRFMVKRLPLSVLDARRRATPPTWYRLPTCASIHENDGCGRNAVAVMPRTANL